MRHRKKVNKLGRTKAHRKATLQNIAKAIFDNHQIKTTLAKAKAARSVVERLITYGKKNTVAARRLAFKVLQNHQLVKKLFDEIAPTYADRNGGYTRIVKLGRRKGDGAELAILQLVGFEPMIIEERKARKAKKKVNEERKKAKEKAAEKDVKEKVEQKETKEEKKVEEKVEANKVEEEKNIEAAEAPGSEKSQKTQKKTTTKKTTTQPKEEKKAEEEKNIKVEKAEPQKQDDVEKESKESKAEEESK